MYATERHLVVISLLCLGFIAFAAGIRVNQDWPEPARTATNAPYPPPTLRTDSNFFETLPAQQPIVKAPEKEDQAGVTALAYLVGNVETGQVYLSKNPSQVLPVASMSKLVTAFAVTDMFSQSKFVEITKENTNVASDTSNLAPGEKFTIGELLFPLLLSSSNVAAEALASSSDRIKFLEQMSSYAWEIGMPSSSFGDPSGLTPHNAASAHDLFALARYLYKSRPDILAITRMPIAAAATTSDHGAHIFHNIHPFVRETNFIGGKTGYTDAAGDTMLTIVNLNGKKIAVVVLGSNRGMRAADTRWLIDQLKKTGSI